jgi:hypothetical protein
LAIQKSEAASKGDIIPNGITRTLSRVRIPCWYAPQHSRVRRIAKTFSRTSREADRRDPKFFGCHQFRRLEITNCDEFT